jgi:peptidyl-prolyl cis-trans isomerase C
MNSKRKKEVTMYQNKLWMNVVVMVITFSLFLAGVQAEEQKSDARDDLVLAKVGDKELKFADLNKMIKMMPPSYQSMFSNIDQMKKLLDVQINSILFSQEARRLKLDQKPEVKQNIDEIVNRILMQALIEDKVNKDVTATDKEIEEYYKNNQDEFKVPEKVKVSHILIKVGPKATEKVKEAKKKKAEEILAKAKAGEDFAELAKQYSEDKRTNKKGGDVGFFAKGSKGPEFEKAVFSLKKNEISDLVLTKKGYHIIKLLDKKEGRKKTLEEAKASIKNKVKQQKRTESYENLLNDLKEKNKVVIYEDALTKITGGSKEKTDKK